MRKLTVAGRLQPSVEFSIASENKDVNIYASVDGAERVLVAYFELRVSSRGDDRIQLQVMRGLPAIFICDEDGSLNAKK